MPGMAQRAGVAAHCLRESINGVVCGRFPGKICDIEGKKVTSWNKSVDRFQADMVGIDMVSALPTQRSYGGVGFRPDVVGFAMDDHMLAIGFVPNRVNVDPQVTGFQEGLELSSTLVREPVTDAKGVFFDFHDSRGGMGSGGAGNKVLPLDHMAVLERLSTQDSEFRSRERHKGGCA